MGSIGFRKGILSGESAYREYAAFLLDILTTNGQHGVPITAYVELYHPYYNKDL